MQLLHLLQLCAAHLARERSHANDRGKYKHHDGRDLGRLISVYQQSTGMGTSHKHNVNNPVVCAHLPR